MSYFSEKFKAHLKSIGWNPYRVWKFFKDKPVGDGLSENYIYQIFRGKPIKKVDALEKLSTVEGLGLSLAQLKVWWLIDQATYEERTMMFEELAALTQ